jgi:hypothetical protein
MSYPSYTYFSFVFFFWYLGEEFEKNILILVEEKKKKSDSEFLSYNLMLNSEEKNILTLVLSEKNFVNEKKHIPPPCKLNGRSLSAFCYSWPTHINGMYVCVLGIPKGKFSKQTKKKKLSYRIIRIKRIFPEFIDV